MALAGIELRFIVDHISDQLDGYYVNNIYGITRDSILFKLHHTTKDDLFLMISVFGIWLTSTKLSQIEENKMQRRLRSNLLRMRLESIKQIGAERIVYLTFEGFDNHYVLVVELFGDGNVILCDEQNMKILALMRSVNVRHRTLNVGSVYMPPPAISGNDAENTIDILNLSAHHFNKLQDTDMAVARWIGRSLGLPKKYAEGILYISNIKSGTIGQQLNTEQVNTIFSTIQRLVSDIINGNHRPAIIYDGDKSEAIPIKDIIPDTSDSESSKKIVSVSTFMAGLDKIFTESLIGKARDVKTSHSATRIKDLQTKIIEQEKAIRLVMDRSESISALARSLMSLASQGVLSMSDAQITPALEQCNARIIQEKGAHLILISDNKKINVNMETSLQSVASKLFDEAKHQAKAAPAIQKSMQEAQRKLAKLQNTAESDRSKADELASEIRKKSWFERYRWFLTSDGSLAVGGRDAASNSAVIRKQMSKDDRVFHAEVHGSPFFILKDAVSPSDVSMNEVAHATVCFSRAWKEGMYGMSAFWVHPDQVKKSAPTGQFLPKGSFTIQGQRNLIRAQTLRLAVGIIKHNDDYILICGPPEPIISHCVIYAIIEPHGFDLAEAAKRIRTEFLNVNETITKIIHLDDFVRVLPSGKSQIKDIGYKQQTQKRDE